MQNRLFLTIFILLLQPGFPFAQTSVIPSKTTQLLLVLTDDWQSNKGKMLRFERQDSTSEWLQDGYTIPVAIGRSGLGWGRGLHPVQEVGPKKQEGDGRAPAGIFDIGALFGYDQHSREDYNMPYIRAGASILCIDDSFSSFYNQVIDTTGQLADWNSFEDMLRNDDIYSIGAIVNHNTNPVTPGSGSCIFLHVWSGENSPTLGCTAMKKADMILLADWFDARYRPVLVQLPINIYKEKKSNWRMPDKCDL